ncbi:hypothetical protein OG379_00095 [Streptomyces sp. NBC_01166]|uniref:hypothetical protein n=1 Tax=Streptomyces sp. NBC_01166 TaxID=2903755 RepID=UPI00386BA31C|nr:hypothetical protein OG379_00095 [Streptomyces sp. NBC_01166]
MQRFSRCLRAGLAVMLLSVLGIVATAGSADADSPLVACTGSQNSNHSPGVTNVPQTVTVDSVTSYTCVLPLLGSVSHTEHSVVPGLSCPNLLNTAPGAVTLHWSDGQSSAFSFTQNLEAVNGVTTLIRLGSITSGRFAGHTVTETLVGASLNLTACASTGITNYSFPVGTLVIV